MNIEEVQSLRNIFLLKLYEISAGKRMNCLNMFEIGNSSGIDDQITETIVNYLLQKGFVEKPSKEPEIYISSSGIDEIENLYFTKESIITSDEISFKLNEINKKLNLLSLGQQVIYEDIMDQLDKGNSIQKKDFLLILLSEAFSKGIEAIKISQLLDLLK